MSSAVRSEAYWLGLPQDDDIRQTDEEWYCKEILSIL